MSEYTTVKDEYAAVLTSVLTGTGLEPGNAELAAIEQVRQLDTYGLLPTSKEYRRGGVPEIEPEDSFSLAPVPNPRGDEVFGEPPADLVEDEFVLTRYVTEWVKR